MDHHRIRRVVAVALSLSLSAVTTPGLSGQRQTGAPVDQDERDVREKRDPCEQALIPPGHAYGLQRRCEAHSTGGAAKGDFNGDGFADLAVGAPHEDLSGVGGVGVVNIIYGSAAACRRIRT